MSAAELGPVQSAASRLDAVIDNWSTIGGDEKLTELVRVRGLLGVGPIVEGAVDDDLLVAAAKRCEETVAVLQSAGGSSTEIVVFRNLVKTFRLWSAGDYEPTARNTTLRGNAVAMASALVTGRAVYPAR